MKKILLLILTTFSLLKALVLPQTNFVGGAVVPNDKTYYIHKQDNIEIIYTKGNAPFAKHTSKIEPSIHAEYEKLFDWKLDERLSVGLISDHNQIANGFSTQFPNNRQINYLGGTSFVDYFTTTSWLDTLLYHETAHNYQVNVKSSSVSQGLHSIFGNGSFIIPTFTLPNLTENSFMLEGNAVLNESWHGNGGRLYSGRFYAQTLLQAKAGKIKPGEVYNSKVEFPYGEIVYIQGGFYNLYMAQNYGLKSINSYFKHHSEDWLWPFFTNASMAQAAGVDFETSVESFSEAYKKIAESQKLASGELVASSQFFYQMNSDKDEIFFLTNESGARAPELVRINKKDKSISKKRDSYSASKLIKIDGKFYTQTSANTSATKITQGLFDNNKFIKEGTESKMVQGYLRDKTEVYFDVTLSCSQPQLFIGDKFYAQVNSSVYIDKNDNLYYFVQNAKKRTLYKNKTPLMSLNGYYGFVNDVDSEGGIYFISNTKYGSSLFMLKDSKVSRVSDADNVIEARLINDDEVLIAAISDRDYYYVTTKLQSIDDTPFEVKHFFEDKEYFAKTKEQNLKNLPNLEDDYNSFTDMRYSGLDFGYGISTSNQVIGSINLKFADPLGQNAMNAFVSRDEQNVSIAGVGYESALTLLNYGIYAYGVIENSQKDSFGNKVDVRDNGIMAFAQLPLYKVGYYNSALKFSYYQDYNTKSRQPLTLQAKFTRYEQYGKSRYANYLNEFSIYGVKDRDDMLYGAKYNFTHDLPAEFYFSLNAKYSKSVENINFISAYLENRGVKLSNSSYSLDLDVSTIGMRSINANYYIKSAGFVDVGLKKVFNFSSYWFTFPLSLQRETLKLNYKYFDIKGFSGNSVSVDEIRAGISFDLVVFNNAVIPFYIDYIYNDSILSNNTNLLFVGMAYSY